MIRSKEFVVMTQSTTYLNHPKRDVTCCDVAAAQSLIATGQQDGRIFLWDSSEGTVLMVLGDPGDDDHRGTSTKKGVVGHEGSVNAVSFNEDISLMSAGEDGQLLLWDLQSRGCRKLTGHGGSPILCCKFSPDASILATGARDTDI